MACYLNQKHIHIITCVTYMFTQRHGWYKQNEGLKERWTEDRWQHKLGYAQRLARKCQHDVNTGN